MPWKGSIPMAVSLQTIESQDLTLGKLFSDYYAVPSFQREYVWGETQVEQLLKDIHDEFSTEGRSDASEYFIGSIVVCARPDNIFDLIDGQQRMTTAYLTLCALRDHLDQISPGSAPKALEQQIASTDINERGEDVFRFRVTLQYDDSCGVLADIARRRDIREIEANTRSVTNILNAYNVIRTFLSSEFDDDVAAVRQYYAYFTNRVKLIRVKTISLTHALKVFETINDRGVGLDSMDLLKNLMFMRARPDEFERLKDRWKALVDTLYAAPEKPLRFLRYFILASYRVDRLREDEIYKWFVDNERECGYKSRPVQFVEELLRSARAYAHFINGRDAGGASNRYLDNISYLSGAARQHFILLLAARNLPTSLFDELCRHLENLFFAYVITREPTKDFEHRFAQWAPEVRALQSASDLEGFLLQRIQPAKEALASRFDLALQGLHEQALQKYRLRYVLAKLTQYVDERAWGSEAHITDLGHYISSRVDIEHILPQTPTPDVLKQFDRPDEIMLYIRKLGNLTLAEKTINCSVGNGLFAAKRGAYRQSQFLLTRSLGEHVTVGVNTAVDRAVRDLEDFPEWTSSAIDNRQAMLSSLAYRVWDMPNGTSSNATEGPSSGAQERGA